MVKFLWEHVVSFVCWIVFVVAVVYLICDIYVNGDAMAREYVSMIQQGEILWSKSAFLAAYKENLIQEDSREVVSSLTGINISTALFSEASVRLNTQIYGIADSLIQEMSKVDIADLNSSSDVSYVFFLEHLNPIMVMAPLNTEMGNVGDKAYTWTPAIYSRVLTENGVDLDSTDFDVDDVCFQMFATDSGLVLYLSCGHNCNRQDGAGIAISDLLASGGTGSTYESAKKGQHISSSTYRNYNDNDSLGPMQVLRRYLYAAGGEIAYPRYGKVISDLMSWRDNVVYWYCSYIDKVRGNKWKSWDSEYAVSSEYEMVMLLAIGHNAGPSLYSRDGSDRGSYSRFRDVGEALKWVKFVMECEERTGVLKECVNSWYEDNFNSSRDQAASFTMPGEMFGVGTSNGRSNLARLFGQSLPCDSGGAHVADCRTGDFIVGDACVFTGYQSNGQYFGGAHKAVYPIKVLVDYMALVKLYTSGGVNGEGN